MKTKHQQRIEEFMKLAVQNLPDKPTEPSLEVRKLRAKLILEEAMETIKKGLGLSIFIERRDEEGLLTVELSEPKELRFYPIGKEDKFNMTELIDGCCDLSVVTIGTLSACGVPDKPFLREVDKNNLAKFGPGGKRREDGKWEKPPGHQPPDIEGVLCKIHNEKYLNARYEEIPLDGPDSIVDDPTLNKEQDIPQKQIDVGIEFVYDIGEKMILTDAEEGDNPPKGKYFVLHLDDKDDPDFAYCCRMAARAFAKAAYSYPGLQAMGTELSQAVVAVEEELPPLRKPKDE